jgi:hypothetical protein
MRSMLGKLLSRPVVQVTVEPNVVLPEHPTKSAEAIYFDVSFRKLSSQLEDVKTIDQGFYQYFSIASTILPITAGFIGTRDSLIRDCTVAKLALGGAFLCYMAIFVVLIVSVQVSKWDSRPELSQWRLVTLDRNEEEMQRWLGDACADAYANNEPVIEERARRSGLVLRLLFGEAAGLMVAVLAPLWPLW